MTPPHPRLHKADLNPPTGAGGLRPGKPEQGFQLARPLFQLGALPNGIEAVADRSGEQEQQGNGQDQLNEGEAGPGG
jgi:hypothetical protein